MAVVVHRTLAGDILAEGILAEVARIAVEEVRSPVSHTGPLVGPLVGPRTDPLGGGLRSQPAHHTAQVALHSLAVHYTAPGVDYHTDYLVDGTRPVHLLCRKTNQWRQEGVWLAVKSLILITALLLGPGCLHTQSSGVRSTGGWARDISSCSTSKSKQVSPTLRSKVRRVSPITYLM